MSALQFLISAALTKNLSSIMARRRLWPCGGNGCPNGTSVLIYNFCGFGDNIGARAPRRRRWHGMGWDRYFPGRDGRSRSRFDSQFAQVATYVCPTRGRASEK